MSAVLVESGPDKGAIWHFGEPNKEQKELVAGDAWADLSHRGVLSVTGNSAVFLIATSFALGAAFLNAAFGFCLGCQIYLILVRLTKRS